MHSMAACAIGSLLNLRYFIMEEKKKNRKTFLMEEVNEAIVKAVRTLEYDQPTDDQKDAISSFLS